MKTYSILLMASLTLTSCGKNKEESDVEKTKLELVKKNNANEQTNGFEQKSNLGEQIKLAEKKEPLQQFPATLAQAESKAKEGNDFQEGSASAAEEKPINDVYQQSSENNAYRNTRKNDIAQLRRSDTFDFLKSPKNLMNYIFKSAKSGDFTNFHYLCDPYADNDGDTKEICSMKMLTQEQQEEFMTIFGNGKIIGEPKIIGDQAEVEFEFGPDSNKHETMNLINRNGLWYLNSF